MWQIHGVQSKVPLSAAFAMSEPRSVVMDILSPGCSKAKAPLGLARISVSVQGCSAGIFGSRPYNMHKDCSLCSIVSPVCYPAKCCVPAIATHTLLAQAARQHCTFPAGQGWYSSQPPFHSYNTCNLQQHPCNIVHSQPIKAGTRCSLRCIRTTHATCSSTYSTLCIPSWSRLVLAAATVPFAPHMQLAVPPMQRCAFPAGQGWYSSQLYFQS